MEISSSVLGLLRSRRSVRLFQARPVEPELIEAVLEGALRSPSSKMKRPWHFVVVSDPAILEALSCSKPHGSSFLKGAPVAVVVLASACDHVRQLLDIPDNLEVLSIVGLGYPDEQKPPHAIESLLQGRIHRERFSNPAPC